MQRSVILMPNWIGDFVLALSVVLHKARVENTDITLLAPPAFFPLCTMLCALPVLPYKRKTREEFRSTLKAVRGGRFDKMYILPPSFSSAWCAFRSAIPKRRGISHELRRILLTEALPASLRDTNQHITYEYSLVLETDYNPPQYGEPVAIDMRRGEYADAVILCPGAQYGPAKKWPWFGELIEKLSEPRIVLLGGPEDTQAGNMVEASAPGRVENLIGKTTIAQAAGIIAAARLVISNDSGLMHLAGFLGTPVVGIFGSTTPVWTAPLGKKTVCAKIHCDCSPCFKRTCKYGHYHCLKNLSPDFVVSAAEHVVKKKNY